MYCACSLRVPKSCIRVHVSVLESVCMRPVDNSNQALIEDEEVKAEDEEVKAVGQDEEENKDKEQDEDADRDTESEEEE